MSVIGNYYKNNSEINKIDSGAVDGLLGVPGSLAYKMGTLERHHHNYEKWFGDSKMSTF